MSRFHRCQRCRERGGTSPVDMRTLVFEYELKVTWRLCSGCFPAAVREFNLAAGEMATLTKDADLARAAEAIGELTVENAELTVALRGAGGRRG